MGLPAWALCPFNKLGVEFISHLELHDIPSKLESLDVAHLVVFEECTKYFASVSLYFSHADLQSLSLWSGSGPRRI